MPNHRRRLELIERHHGHGGQGQGQTIVRWRGEDGTEYLQFAWNGVVSPKVYHSWMFDSWDEDEQPAAGTW